MSHSLTGFHDTPIQLLWKQTPQPLPMKMLHQLSKLLGSAIAPDPTYQWKQTNNKHCVIIMAQKRVAERYHSPIIEAVRDYGNEIFSMFLI